jgi:hypothetical protein
MLIGLRQGFVTFGSVAHRILKQCLEDEFVNHNSLRRTIDSTAVATTLKRLVENKMLFEVGRHRYPHVNKSCSVYALDRKSKYTPYRILTRTERTQAYRHRKQHQVASVFDWRGTHEVSR